MTMKRSLMITIAVLAAAASQAQIFAEPPSAEPIEGAPTLGMGIYKAETPASQPLAGPPSLVMTRSAENLAPAPGALTTFGTVDLPGDNDPVPEPATMAILAGGIAAVIARRRRRSSV